MEDSDFSSKNCYSLW